MVQYREWHNTDKSTWGTGEWQDEPDKVQFQDEASGLPCLIVRNGSGALCGYVGVTKTHPAFGHHYGDYDSDNPVDQQIVNIRVHGGLTFAHSCSEPTEEMFNRMKRQVDKQRKQAAIYPIGDSAEWLATWESALNDYDQWKEVWNSRSICHITDVEDEVWWFGFDCSHCDDFTPAHSKYLGYRPGKYRNIAYVKAEIKELAEQLQKIS